MKDIDKNILDLGNSLKDRLDEKLINSALEYIDFSERGLAFDTLCDYIEDFNIELTGKENLKLLNIIKELNSY